MATIDKDKLEHAIELLRGTEGYRVASILSFGLSIAIFFGAIFWLDTTREQRVISVLATLFLVSSSFTLAKTVRDTLMSEVLGIELLAGTRAWSIQCFASFWIALLASVYAAWSLDVERSVLGFVLIGLSFALSSTISLAKLIRDRQDADYFEEQSEEATEQNVSSNYERVVRFCAGAHQLHGYVTWVAFIMNVLAFFYALYEFDLNAERTDFLGLGVMFMIYAALLLAKAVRDNASSDLNLHPSQLHWTMYVLACVISCGLLFDTILRLMPLSPEHRTYLSLNAICILSVTFNLAKTVRDRQEVERLQSQDGWNIEVLRSSYKEKEY